MQDENSEKGMKKLTESSFFTLIRPFLAFVDSPRYFTLSFTILYFLIAFIYLLSPFGILGFVISNELLEGAETKLVFSFVLSWIAILIASWIAFQVWLNRRKSMNVDKITSDVIIDALSHLVYTTFEATAVYAAIAGTFGGLFMILFGGGIFENFGIGADLGFPVIIGSLIGGYIGITFAKFFGFLFKKIAQVLVYAIKRIFFFMVHVIKQLFEYGFIFVQSIVDYMVNGWRVVVALVARLGNYLLMYAKSPYKTNSGMAEVHYEDQK